MKDSNVIQSKVRMKQIIVILNNLTNQFQILISHSSMDNVSDWQHPFVDVFKRFNTFDCPKSYKGSVQIIHDPAIARKCFKLSGSILSNNTITIPDPNSDIKSCNLTGRYIYVELFASPEKYFCVHFEIAIKDREPGVRLTLTNMEKEYTVAGGNTLKIPYAVEGRNLWSVVCIDIEHHLENFGLFSKGAIRNYTGVHTVKAIQVCSNCSVRGIYTSCNIYDWQTLPKEMAFKMVKGGKWQDSYNFVYLPKAIDPQETKKKLKAQQQANQSALKDFPSNIVEMQQASTTRKKKLDTITKPMQPSSMKPQYQPLPSEPFLQLNSAFSFSSLYNPDLIFMNSNLYYSAGGILICKNTETGQQQFLQGHTGYIVGMDAHQNWLVTVQQGAKSMVRIWIDHKCVCYFESPYEKVQQIRLSHKKHLAMVGLDQWKRQAILVFDISQIQITRKPQLIAKQLSDFNIITLKFSPINTEQLVSCGKQNIRFWRVKNQHLPGSPVVLNHHARNTIFTVFDFMFNFDDKNPIKQTTEVSRVLVGSQNGLLFQINYTTHELEEVYKLHDNAAITSILVSANFVVTGGEDQLLRIWPKDFSEYSLQAANDGVVTNLALSEDASKVACGTSIGTLTVLDLTTNQCKTIVRAHTQQVFQICYHQFSNSMLTLSSDHTIRVWDCNKLQQTYQFPYPQNDPCLCISANPNGMLFAAGFKSGTLRIIDIQNVSVTQQITHHSNPILHIEYSPDGRFLSVLEEKLNMLYSPLHSHQPIKQLPVEIPSKYKHSSFSEDSQLIALIGDSGTHVNVWDLKTLGLVGKIFVGKVVRKVKFCGSDSLWVMCEDTSIRRYNLEKMTVEVEMQAMHRQALNDIDFDLDSHLLFTVGADSFVRVWDYSFLRQPHQVFIGHSKSVNGVAFHDNKLWTVGSEGVLVWDFHQPNEKFIPPPIFAKQKKATFINNPIESTSKQPANIQNQQQIQNLQPIPQKPQKVKFSAVLKKNGQSQSSSKFVPKKLDSNFLPKTLNYRKNKKRQGKPKLTTDLPQLNIVNKLPLRHYFQQSLSPNQFQYPRKIQQLKQNPKKYKLEYIAGIEPAIHDHTVWNFMYGWYAYIYDNLIIVQSLNKNRSQRIITLPEKLSTLTLSKDFKKLICSSAFNPNPKQKLDLSASEDISQLSNSSSGEQQSKNTANIYVLGLDFTIQKKFQFHPKGVQAMRLSQFNNNKFLVSIGNFRECTVCVWDYGSGKLKASGVTLDKLNDLAIVQQQQQGKLLQFATVGRDQVHFWTFTKDEKLQYYDVFVTDQQQDDERQSQPKQKPQLTACDFLKYEENHFLLCGTTKGELIIIRCSDYKIIWRKIVCSGEIMNLRCYQQRTAIGSSDGNVYFWNHNSNILQAQPNPSFVRMNLYYSVNSLYFDEQGTEGVIGTSEAIYYVNLAQQFHSLLAGSSPSPILMTKSLNSNQFLLTSHQSGRLKLWNVQTAQQLKTYKWKYPCTQAYFDQGLNKVVCFCQNQAVKLVNIKKFTKEENYLPEELSKGEPKTDDYIIYTSQVTFNGRTTRWVFSKKGNVYEFEIAQQGKKKVIKAEKVLQLGYTLQQVIVNPEKNLMIVSSNLGVVSAYNIDQHNNTYSLLVVDQAQPQDFSVEKKSTLTQADCSCQDQKRIRIAASKVLNQTYLAICQSSQYVYFRNYMKRVTFQKISLPSIPRSILLNETRKDSQVIIGLKQGGIMTFNAIQPQQRSKYEGIVNNSIDMLFHIKGKNWLMAGHPNAITFYSLE